MQWGVGVAVPSSRLALWCTKQKSEFALGDCGAGPLSFSRAILDSSKSSLIILMSSLSQSECWICGARGRRRSPQLPLPCDQNSTGRYERLLGAGTSEPCLSLAHPGRTTSRRHGTKSPAHLVLSPASGSDPTHRTISDSPCLKRRTTSSATPIILPECLRC